MTSPLKKLFGSTERQDGLEQFEREAIVDALHYCMFADKRIELSENEVIFTWSATLTWTPGQSFESYETKSIAAARAATASDEARKGLIDSIALRISTQKAGDILMQLCREVADADGHRHNSEWRFIEEIRKALNVRMRG